MEELRCPKGHDGPFEYVVLAPVVHYVTDVRDGVIFVCGDHEVEWENESSMRLRCMNKSGEGWPHQRCWETFSVPEGFVVEHED